MIQNKYDLVLSGDHTAQYFSFKEKVVSYISKNDLPLRIVEEEKGHAISVAYKKEVFDISEDYDKKEIQKFYDFLLKINPKTGKVCKCSDCKNCPSKRLIV